MLSVTLDSDPRVRIILGIIKHSIILERNFLVIIVSILCAQWRWKCDYLKSLLQSLCESFLKLDSKTKGPRGGSSIQCRGHQAVRYMSYIPQGWFVLMEKQWSRMIVWDNLIVWDFQVWSATTIYHRSPSCLLHPFFYFWLKKKVYFSCTEEKTLWFYIPG